MMSAIADGTREAGDSTSAHTPLGPQPQQEQQGTTGEANDLLVSQMNTEIQLPYCIADI